MSSSFHRISFVRLKGLFFKKLGRFHHLWSITQFFPLFPCNVTLQFIAAIKRIPRIPGILIFEIFHRYRCFSRFQRISVTPCVLYLTSLKVAILCKIIPQGKFLFLRIFYVTWITMTHRGGEINAYGLVETRPAIIIRVKRQTLFNFSIQFFFSPRVN